MSRNLSPANLAEIDSVHVHEVTLVELLFDTPVYVHSGFGNIDFGGNTYLGVGDFGSVGETRESEALSPGPVVLSLNALDATYLAEALDAGNYGDVVSIYAGFRLDDGTLVDDPYLIWRGKFDYGTAETGDEDSISYTCEHDLSVLSEKNGERLSDVDQQAKFAGDLGLEFLHDQTTVKLAWGRFVVANGGPGQVEQSRRDSRFRIK